mgnify:CR=1 FL=1
MYKPLPKELTIKESSIEGLGLFANEDILINKEFGISHIKNKLFEDDYIRTPLGRSEERRVGKECSSRWWTYQ